MEYIDCYLIHWPFSIVKNTKKLDFVPLHETWKQLEICVNKKLTKSIGVSNFNCQLIMDLLTYCEIKPIIN